MKIAIDVSQIVYGTGVSVYTENLVKNLSTIDSENEYLLFAGALRRKREILSVFPGTKVFPLPPSLADIVWNKLHIFPIEKLIGKVDVLHTSDWTEPPSNAFKITTVHDLYPFKFPRMVSPNVREVHRRKMGWVLRESQRIIVPSESTRKDLTELGAREKRIRVIPEAPSLSKASPSEVEAVKKKYNLQGEYLVAIGITPLKNTIRIIKAFHLGKVRRDIKLVLIGRPQGIKIGEERNMRILGHVPQKDLGALLTGSAGLIFASLYEGYGIPILDAFNCGIPVITSNLSSMPEVAGDAAVLVNPYDVNSIADGIVKALKGPKGLIEKGSVQVRNFSWEKTARQTLEVYKEVDS